MKPEVIYKAEDAIGTVLVARMIDGFVVQATDSKNGETSNTMTFPLDQIDEAIGYAASLLVEPVKTRFA